MLEIHRPDSRWDPGRFGVEAAGLDVITVTGQVYCRHGHGLGPITAAKCLHGAKDKELFFSAIIILAGFVHKGRGAELELAVKCFGVERDGVISLATHSKTPTRNSGRPKLPRKLRERYTIVEVEIGPRAFKNCSCEVREAHGP
jgi:hypothetical protein